MEHARVSHLWLIKVLSDLHRYAERNNLPALAEHLETAVQLAHLEIVNTSSAQGKEIPPPNQRKDDM